MIYFLSSIGKHKEQIKEDLAQEETHLFKDKEFLLQGLREAEKTLESKKKERKSTTEDTLCALNWDIQEYKHLCDTNVQLLNLSRSFNSNGDECTNESLAEFKSSLKKYTKDLSMKKREVASHLMIFMIADELRNMKPYAIPVRVLPYKSITDSMCRYLREEVRNVMTSIGMEVVGTKKKLTQIH